MSANSGRAISGFLLRWKEKESLPPPAPKSTEAGFSLVSALIALAITAMGMVAAQRVHTLTFRGSSHADLRGGIRSLSDSLKPMNTQATVR